MISYRQLLQRTDGPKGSSWGLFGADDELGTVNFISPDTIAAAAQCIRSGKPFNLDCKLGEFNPPLFPSRKQLRHEMFANNRDHRDDYLDSFYLQASTQIDGLRHMRHPIHGFYNHTKDEDVDVGMPRLGIQGWSQRGIAGRGVLLDIDRHLKNSGKSLDHKVGEPFSVDLLEATAEAQGITFRSGDILLLRTGWLEYYRNELDDEGRRSLPGNMRCSGLIQSEATLEFLWDNQFSVVAADNVGLECVPASPSSPFALQYAGDDRISPALAAMMHIILIPLLGLCVGELWDFEALANDCASDGVYEAFLTAKPLNLTGGAGSPANALAIK